MLLHYIYCFWWYGFWSMLSISESWSVLTKHLSFSPVFFNLSLQSVIFYFIWQSLRESLLRSSDGLFQTMLVSRIRLWLCMPSSCLLTVCSAHRICPGGMSWSYMLSTPASVSFKSSYTIWLGFIHCSVIWIYPSCFIFVCKHK